MFLDSRSGAPKLAMTALVAALMASGTLQAFADPVTPAGIWYTDGDESIVKVHACGADADTYCGTLVWLKEPKEADGSTKVDKLNKDAAKRGKPLVGLDILLDMKSDEDHWTGKAYNPEDGKLYDITFKVKTDKQENDQADLRGCIMRFLCKTETFNRAKEVPGGDPTADAAGKKKKSKHEAAKH